MDCVRGIGGLKSGFGAGDASNWVVDGAGGGEIDRLGAVVLL